MDRPEHGRVGRAKAWLCDIPAATVRVDAVQTFTKQETIFVALETTSGHTGLGYSYTIGTGGRAVLSLLREDLLPVVVREDPRRLEAIWQRAVRATHATSPGVITSLALAAIDVALWDLRCQTREEPLWIAAGGAQSKVPLYATEGGWLQLSTEELVSAARASIEAGFHGVKVKVGKPDAHEDLERLQAVRAAIGDRAHLMVDANQSLSLADALRRARLFESVDVYWFEEPLPVDDVLGHQRLAASTSIPIAIGESITRLGQFREYLCRSAAGVVQPDVARVGGISPWLKIAHLAEAFNVAVAPHFLMELHVSLAAAVSNAIFVEHIPQLTPLLTEGVAISEGYATPSSIPGLGIAWNHDAIGSCRGSSD